MARPAKPAVIGSAQRVAEFPRATSRGRWGKYPWREMAEDGGIFRMDPADYNTTARNIRSAAMQWAYRSGYVATSQIVDGIAYISFTEEEG
jgi:hypothetical protein